MKNLIILLFLLMSSFSSASDSYWEGAIIEKMLLSISINKKPVVFSQSEHINKLLKKMNKVDQTDTCINADVVLSDLKEINKSCEKPTIVFDYRSFRNNSSAIGVFFWQKGRPTIRFSEKRLDHYGLTVKGELSKFVSSNN